MARRLLLWASNVNKGLYLQVEIASMRCGLKEGEKKIIKIAGNVWMD